MNQRLVMVLGTLLVLLVGAVMSKALMSSRAPIVTPIPSATVMPTVTMPTPTPTLITPSPTIAPTPQPTVQSGYFFPMTRYAERKTVRWYGKQVGETDRQLVPCGDTFTGYHTGDDLEPLGGESNQEIPVYAIAAGKIRQVRAVSGYGGLLVIEHVLNNQTYTVYYGHIDLNQKLVSEGGTINAGQRIALLGDHCSPETSNERKHLHFAIHKGTTINVKGYAANTNELAEWVNPEALLQQLSAQIPS
jgi:murein DD-endopeptidase MepM/ murein hydrolase activator NlpD